MIDNSNSNGCIKNGRRRPSGWLVVFASLVILIGVVTLVRDPEQEPPWSETNRPRQVPDHAAEFSSDHSLQHGPLTIATWNINYNKQDLDEVSRTLRGSGADFVCLQETTAQSESWLQRELAQDYPSQFVAGHTGKFFAEGFMVLSRTQIVNPHFVPPARTFFGHVVFETEHGGQRVTVITVHMTPFTTRGARSVPQLISVLGQTEAGHLEEVPAILRDVPQDRPVVILSWTEVGWNSDFICYTQKHSDVAVNAASVPICPTTQLRSIPRLPVFLTETCYAPNVFQSCDPHLGHRLLFCRPVVRSGNAGWQRCTSGRNRIQS